MKFFFRKCPAQGHGAFFAHFETHEVKALFLMVHRFMEIWLERDLTGSVSPKPRSANAESVGFKLACNVHVFEKWPVLAKTYFLQKLACGLIQECFVTIILRIGKFHLLWKMFNKNGNSHLMSYEEKLTFNFMCVPFRVLETKCVPINLLSSVFIYFRFIALNTTF